MIFKMIRIYRMSKQGINDPAGLVSDELRDAYIGTVIIPGIILLAVIVPLGILSFSSLITAPSVVAQVFFWIFLLAGIAYTTLVVVIGKFLGRLVRKGEQVARKVISDNESV